MQVRACVKGVERLVVGHDGAVTREGRRSDRSKERACKGKDGQHNEIARIFSELNCGKRAAFCGERATEAWSQSTGEHANTDGTPGTAKTSKLPKKQNKPPLRSRD